MRSPSVFTVRLAALLLALLAALAPSALAHEGEDHGDDGASAAASASGLLGRSAMSRLFEAVLYHAPTPGGRPFTGTLYLADYATNAPVAGAEIVLQPLGLSAPATVTATDRAGVYAVSIPGGFPRDGHYDLSLQVQAGERSDLLLIEQLSIGPAPVEAAPAGTGEGAGEGLPWVWIAVVGLLGLGFAAFLVRSARQRHRAADAPPPPVSSPAAPTPTRAPRPERSPAEPVQ